MEANELRIGNIIQGVSAEVYVGKVSSICKYAIGIYEKCDWIRLEHCSPITLTEEWLVKFGFRKEQDHIWLFPYNDSLRLWGFAWSIQQWLISDKWVDIPTLSIQYVHQLQNLYFTLTGKELKLEDNEEY